MAEKWKRILLICTAVVFVAVVTVCFVMLFSLKTVNVEFKASENESFSSEIQEKLEGYKGSSLVLLSTDAIKEELSKHPYIEVISISKEFPSTLKVELKERTEAYVVDFENKTFILSDEGIVLKQVEESKRAEYLESRLHIKLSFEGVNVLSANVGSKIETDSVDSLDCMLQLTKVVDITDCVDTLLVERKESTSSGKQTVLNYGTYTEVKIVITDAEYRGEEKILEAFNAYKGESSDYKKSYNKIQVIELDNGDLRVSWDRQ